MFLIGYGRPFDGLGLDVHIFLRMLIWTFGVGLGFDVHISLFGFRGPIDGLELAVRIFLCGFRRLPDDLGLDVRMCLGGFERSVSVWDLMCASVTILAQVI